MGMLFKLILQTSAPLFRKLFRNKKNVNKIIHDMATQILEFNQLNLEAMNKKTAIRHGQNYHEDGIGTVTVLLAIATVAIIFYSIYSAL